MKFPSLLRTPQHQRFRIEPRYYDPVREDIQNRTSRISKELELENSNTAYSSSLNGAFQRRSKTTSHQISSIRQLVIIITFFVLAFGYLEIGNAIFHVLWLFVPVYIFYRLNQRKRK